MQRDVIMKELLRDYGWSRESLAVWCRAGHKCEYCGVSLLDSSDDYLYGSHIDHIIPGGGKYVDNLALACKTCNFIKSDKNFQDPESPLRRENLIAKAKVYISKRRELNEQRLSRVRQLLASLEHGSVDG